jgi:hypothetical protein
MAFWGVVAFALANTVAILRLLIGRLGMIPIKHHILLQTLLWRQALEKFDDIMIIQNLFKSK